MILRELQTYLAKHQRASLAELAQKFHSDPEALRGMLQPLLRKGRVQKSGGAGCKSCCNCAPETLEFYEWVGKP